MRTKLYVRLAQKIIKYSGAILNALKYNDFSNSPKSIEGGLWRCNGFASHDTNGNGRREQR